MATRSRCGQKLGFFLQGAGSVTGEVRNVTCCDCSKLKAPDVTATLRVWRCHLVRHFNKMRPWHWNNLRTGQGCFSHSFGFVTAPQMRRHPLSQVYTLVLCRETAIILYIPYVCRVKDCFNPWWMYAYAYTHVCGMLLDHLKWIWLLCTVKG